MKRFYAILTVLLFLCSWTQVRASHAMGADLTYTCVGPNQYRLRLSFYRDCSGITPSNAFNIYANSASCGQALTFVANQVPGYPVEVSPLCAAQITQSTCNGGTLPGVQQWVYEVTVTLPQQCSDWRFWIREGNRNATITTISAPDFAYLYVETIMNNIQAPCNNSPTFTTPPIPYICLGQSYIYNHGAVDSDGDSLVYTLINALDNSGVSVTYNGGFSGTNPMTSTPPVGINNLNGNITMNPTATQVAVIAVRVDEYRNGVLIGSSIRDIQVTVLNCTNNVPVINNITSVTGGTLVSPNYVEVCPGTPLSFTIPGTDADGAQTIAWTWNNGIPGGVFTGPSGGSPQNATFSWTPTTADVGLNSLLVTLEDNACPVTGQQVRAIDIRVLQDTYAGPDRGYCTSGGPVQLQAVGGTSFTWTILSGSPGSLSCTNCANPLATPTVPTTYVVQSNLSGTCKNRDTVVVTPAPSFTLNMSPNQNVCLGSSATISATPNPAGTYTYLWSPGAGTFSSASVTPVSNTTYNVSVTSAAGCRMTGSTTLTVVNQPLSVTAAASPLQSCAGAPVNLTATVSNNACAQYSVTSITHAPTGGGGWTTLTLSDDQLSAAIPLGFTFNFFCNNYTNVYVSSNGFVSFDGAAGSGCCSGQNIPSTTTPNNAIFVHHEDYNPPGGGSVRYKVVGTAPNRKMVIHYNGIPHLSGTGTALDAQVMLYETTHDVEIHITNAGTDGTGETEGIENAAGTIAFTVPGRNATPWSATNSAHRFTQAVPLPTTVSWQAPLGTTLGTGLNYTATPSSTTTFYAVANNGACAAQAAVSVDVTSVSAGPDINLCPGNSTTLNAVYSGPAPINNCNNYILSNIALNMRAGTPTTIATGDDFVSAQIALPFNFSFFCTQYSAIRIATNGFITFDNVASAGCCSGQAIPNTVAPNNLIALAWEDFNTTLGGSIGYFTVGTAPNRVFVVQYTGVVHHGSGGGPLTGQIQLYEGTNIVEIHTQNMTTDGGLHTQGIESAGGTLAFPVPGRNRASWSATNDAWRFRPDVATLTYSWSPPTFLSATNIPNPTASGISGTTTYTVTVSNGVCVITDDVTVTVCLPVDDLNLTARADGRDAVRVHWVATNENNLSRYAVERSTDGNNWENLGYVNPQEGTATQAQYAFRDENPYTGINQYRVRALDHDGRHQYSNAAEVNFETGDWAQFSPNPARSTVQLELGITQAGAVQAEIFAADGRRVYVMNRDALAPGVMQERISLADLAAGVYTWQVRTASGVITGRLILE